MKGQGFDFWLNIKAVLILKQMSYEYVRSFKENQYSFLVFYVSFEF